MITRSHVANKLKSTEKTTREHTTRLVLGLFKQKDLGEPPSPNDLTVGNLREGVKKTLLGHA